MMSVSILVAAAPQATVSTQGLVAYLRGLFGPLFLGIVGIVAIFFLFAREITRLVQFIMPAAAMTAVFYAPASRVELGRGWPGRASSPGRLGRLLTLVSRNGHAYQERRSEMSTAEAILAILSAAATVLGTLAGLLWWAFRQGRNAGHEEARREAGLQAQADAAARVVSLEARLTELQAELDSMRSRRRRA